LDVHQSHDMYIHTYMYVQKIYLIA